MSEDDVTWLADHSVGDACAFRIGRRGDEVVAEWVGTATLSARRDGSGARIEIADGASPADVEKITKGSARLLLRHLEGKPALHGAVVVDDGRAVVLLGRSGQGKSTLAAALCAAGLALYADDAAALAQEPGGRWRAAALERTHWLDGAARRALGHGNPPASPSRMGKWPVAAARSGEAEGDEATVVALVDLVFADVPRATLERISGVDALAALVPQAVRFALDDGARHRRELDMLAALVGVDADAAAEMRTEGRSVPIYRLVRPRDFSRLGDSVDLIRGLYLQRNERKTE